jgi:hypothetical protein
MGTIFVDNLEPQSGTSLTLGANGDAINLASGATAGFGKIGQMTSTNFVLDSSITSTSYAELNSSCRLSLTPTATTSKFIFQFQFPWFINVSNTGFFVNVYKDVGGGGYNVIYTSGQLTRYAGYQSSTGNYSFITIQVVDSPSTTSQVTFTPYVKGSNTNTINFGNGGLYFATLMEVLA